MIDEHSDDEYKSKTQIKQEMHALQVLGHALIDLPPSVYQDISDT